MKDLIEYILLGLAILYAIIFACRFAAREGRKEKDEMAKNHDHR